MTPSMKNVLCDLAEQRLAKLQAEEKELTQVIRELRGEPVHTTNDIVMAGVVIAPIPIEQPVAVSSPLETRLEQLREQHGPVYVIDPKNPVASGQRIKWGKAGSEKTVEVLESAELADRTGTTTNGRWFAKLIDV